MALTSLFFLLLSTTDAWHIKQTETLYETEIDLSEIDPAQALAIQLLQTGNSSSLLLLASQDSVKFGFNESSGWVAECQYFQFEGWALGQQKFALVVPAGELDQSKNLTLGVYKAAEFPVEYEITVQSQEPGYCGLACGDGNSCVDSVCNCVSGDLMGEYCHINATELGFNNKSSVSLASEDWQFFRVSLENVTEMTVDLSVSEGTPYLFLLNATDLVIPPSMFNNESEYIQPDEKEKLEYVFDDNSTGYMHISAYCSGSCNFTLLLDDEIKKASRGDFAYILAMSLGALVPLACCLTMPSPYQHIK